MQKLITKEQKTEQRAVLTRAHFDFDKGLNLYAFFKLHDRAVSEDLVQDTFMKTWRYLVKGGRVDLMKAFLYHILNQLIIDEYRKNKLVSLDGLLEKGFEPRDDRSGRLFDILDGKAAILLIQRLPLKYQQVMQMRYVDDLSLAEMSAITGRTKNSMAVEVHRGLGKLRLLWVG